MDVGSIAICIALGALICFVFTGIGVCIGRGNKDDIEREHRPDSDITIYVPCRYRGGSRNKRVRKFSVEEMIFVLNDLKRLTHGWERDIVEAAIDKLRSEEDDEDDC